MRGVIYVQDSSNTKLSGSEKIDASYASILHSCPSSCSLKKNGCYATSSYVGMVNHRMQRRARGASALEIARAESQAIDQSYRGGKVPEGRVLRLHVSGDSRTIKGTRLINSAVARWKKRGRKNTAYTYTHAWANVPRHEWSNVSVLASVESTKQVAAARNQGYACAIVVAEHVSDKAYSMPDCEHEMDSVSTTNSQCSVCRVPSLLQ